MEQVQQGPILIYLVSQEVYLQNHSKDVVFIPETI